MPENTSESPLQNNQNNKNIYELLQHLSIPYQEYTHPAVFTVEEAEEHCSHIPGAHCKNLFFRNKKGDQHFLVIMPSRKPLDIKNLAGIIGTGGLSFASPDRLMRILGLTPGSVTLLGLINDLEKQAKVFIDEELWQQDILNFHPLINTATLSFKRPDLEKFLAHSGHDYQIIKIA